MEGWELIDSITRLPKSFTVDLAHPNAVRSSTLQPEVLQKVSQFGSTFKHLLRDNKGDFYILEQYGAGYHVYWPASGFNIDELRKESSQVRKTDSDVVKKNWRSLRFEDMLDLWKEDQEVRYLSAPIKLNMQAAESTPSSKDQYQTTSPKDYLDTKYYESLFFIHLPLAYFLKSNLERLKSMCRLTSAEDGITIYRKCLTDTILENKLFDKRHEDDNIVTSELSNIIARSKRSACLKKFGIEIQREKGSQDKSDLCLVLRVREIKLQIILLLESIYVDKLDTTFKDYDAKYRGRLKARSLNLARLIPRRSRKERKVSMEKQTEDVFDFCEQLDLYLDKLCILDILLASEPASGNTETHPIQEHKRNMLSKNKETSSVGFANYVLIPHFSSKTPHAIRFITRKLKGPSLRNRKPLHNKDAHREPTTGHATESAPPSTPSLHSFASSSVSSFKSTVGLQHGRGLNTELMDLRSNSSVEEFVESNAAIKRHPSFISRTASDLTMNHLQRRQLSVTELSSHRTASASKETTNAGVDNFNSNFSSQHSFRRVGKRKEFQQLSRSASTTAVDNAVNLIQVMGTPLKKSDTPITKRAKLHNIVESPMNTHKDHLNVEATPEQRPTSENVTAGKRAVNKRVRRKLFAP